MLPGHLIWEAGGYGEQAARLIGGRNESLPTYFAMAIPAPLHLSITKQTQPNQFAGGALGGKGVPSNLYPRGRDHRYWKPMQSALRLDYSGPLRLAGCDVKHSDDPHSRTEYINYDVGERRRARRKKRRRGM